MTKLLTFTLITTMALLTSCGIPLPLQKDLVVKDINAVRQFSTTDPAFSKYVQEFEHNGRKILNDGSFSVGDVPINFGDTENPNFQGVCFEYPDGTKEVIIKKSWWDAVSEDYRESLIFHELGHCSLGRDHLDDTWQNGEETHKKSMMHSIIITPNVYDKYKEGYHKELFTQDTVTLLQDLGLATQ